MKRSDKLLISSAIFFSLCFFILGFSVSQIITIVTGHELELRSKSANEANKLTKNYSIAEEYIIKECRSSSVVNTSDCFRDQIKPFYKYVLTEDDINLTFDELKTMGGDCQNWAFLYEEMGREAGFNSTTIVYHGIPGVMLGHRFAVIWDATDYCEIDQLEVSCKKLVG